MTITEFAPAKVNLGLAVTGKLENGYHSLDTLFTTTDVGDTLTLEATDSGIQLEVIGLPLGDVKDNLVYRAAALYLEATGQTGGVRMTLEKRLPIAAGLGGGSSDAAAALRGLARLYPAGASGMGPPLHAMAKALGADVPFLLNGGAAHGGGVGDLLEPIALPETHLVLANPKVGITAREAYLGLRGRYGQPLELDAILEALRTGEAPPYRNDLELPVLEAYPIVQDVKDTLESAGLYGVLMSGSGSTCFGLARDAAHAMSAAAQIARAQPTWWVAATRTR